MLSPSELEQNIQVILAESTSPVQHTMTIAKKLHIGVSDANSRNYRKVLRALHKLNKSGIVYYWHDPLTGSTWMLKNRDVCHALPHSGRSICLGELPF